MVNSVGIFLFFLRSATTFRLYSCALPNIYRQVITPWCRYLLVFQSASATVSLCVVALLIGRYQSPAFDLDHFGAPALSLAYIFDVFQGNGVDIFSVLGVVVHLFVMATCSRSPRGLREPLVVTMIRNKSSNLFSMMCPFTCTARCPTAIGSSKSRRGPN